MDIKILFPAPERDAVTHADVCPCCGCVFTYTYTLEDERRSKEQDTWSPTAIFLHCPSCGTRIAKQKPQRYRNGTS